MLHNRETTIRNHERFVTRVAESETVWGINIGTGFASADSHDGSGTPVIMFWSDRAYALRAQKPSFPDATVDSIPLLDLLFRWLPGMDQDCVLAGTNWTADLAGLETKPDDLQSQLIDAMSEQLIVQYREMANEIRNNRTE